MFRNIYDAYQPRILRYLTRLVGRQEAEDLTQEVFLKVSRALPGFRGESQPAAWIYRIATNTALDRMRYQKGRDIAALIDLDAAVSDKDVWGREPVPPLDRQLDRREMKACIRNLVDTLPHDYKTVLVLSEFGDLKNWEIADILGISLAAVKMRLHRARAKLQKEFETHCDFYRDERNEFACAPKHCSVPAKKHA